MPLSLLPCIRRGHLTLVTFAYSTVFLSELAERKIRRRLRTCVHRDDRARPIPLRIRRRLERHLVLRHVSSRHRPRRAHGGWIARRRFRQPVRSYAAVFLRYIRRGHRTRV